MSGTVDAAAMAKVIMALLFVWRIRTLSVSPKKHRAIAWYILTNNHLTDRISGIQTIGPMAGFASNRKVILGLAMISLRCTAHRKRGSRQGSTNPLVRMGDGASCISTETAHAVCNI